MAYEQQEPKLQQLWKVELVELEKNVKRPSIDCEPMWAEKWFERLIENLIEMLVGELEQKIQEVPDSIRNEKEQELMVRLKLQKMKMKNRMKKNQKAEADWGCGDPKERRRQKRR